MAYDYDALYAQQPDALGPPTRAFVDFFDSYALKAARVLDVGCGQGRDALFVARLGHQVVGMDIAAHGIKDMCRRAEEEHLSIIGVVTDIVDYTPNGTFDVIVVDRTLHMLAPDARASVLRRLLGHVAANGHVLIADEPASIGQFQDVITRHNASWSVTYRHKGFLFVQKETTQNQ